ncbi:MAG: addiction module antitoxin RelB [Candidatus Muproteobacteria bacterium RIFCSPHIGHO2_12_FULL_60_33]|uniref:Addiction module antitoxin RelB n=1 Tax=Candidatus Muproteobacteria bacterium RIFCSPLOWO2_01_FULL_60_18 TaxID=1817768 RepID=A0A1F6TYQ2_9PROT|nr:MAG: addiction module antitoxin RelB [Candidatus Muproteobacteria bacterium RIFCSPLOWO2_01_FULL_60_18]OGI53957.1 MAG: addiction module antitoxin RelB [Candidatus Muproteobacteria bacterium RIFCSPHIGHO2_12_FULL_60_33]
MSAKPDPKKILDKAMQLEPTARAFVAETLLESLDLDQDFAVSQEWLEEIRRRCAEIDSGKAALLDSAMVINELRGKYTR